MRSATDRLEFAPLRDPDSLRSFGLALLVHALLIGALTWGVNWKRNERDTSFEAELWSALPQQAAPRLTEAPPPTPPPAARTPEARPAPRTPDADIALKQEKKRKQLQKEADEKKALAKQQAEQAQKAKAAKEAELAKRKATEEAKKTEAKKQEAREQANAAALAEQRKKALDRMMGLAGATGDASAKGSAQRASGPSASYGAKVRAKVKDNIVLPGDIPGNPIAEVEVRTTLDGTITSQRLIKSSGNKAWDEVVMRAIIRTGSLPRDVDGRVPTPMIIELQRRE
ncbi:cell envelope integrity protein TolA [Polaromonas sp.]|uniref:cell envelope integrity protein TolA n=1 Tax=Polaromonas sp. TaxID=1869339 RepID=UPI002FCA4199